MNLEDSIVSTISDAKPMMILALCTIVLFVIVASLIEAWLAKARKAKSEADTLPSGPEASQRPGEHFYQLVVPCAGMALIIAGPNGWTCFRTRILIAAALQ